jgi:hypothetical protein
LPTFIRVPSVFFVASPAFETDRKFRKISSPHHHRSKESGERVAVKKTGRVRRRKEFSLTYG